MVQGAGCLAEELDSGVQWRAGHSEGLGRRGMVRIWSGEIVLGRWQGNGGKACVATGER